MQSSRLFDARRRDFVTQSTFASMIAGLGLGAGPFARSAGLAAGAPGSNEVHTPRYDPVTLHFIERRIEVSFQNSLTQMSTALLTETRPVLTGVASS